MAPLATSVAPTPEHTAAEDGLIVKVGVAVTVIIDESIAEQLPLVPVTVYVVVTAGEAVTIAPVVELRPVNGLHEYVVAPLAVRLTLLPEHIDDAGGAMVTVGVLPTVITIESILVHFPVLPVTV